MDGSFGARLRAQREGRQIALATIADKTKIKRSLLEGLERDDVSHWPSGIFRRSYIRAYAQAIGLDADAVVREFLRRHPDPAEDQSDAVEALATSRGSAGRKPPTRLRFLIGSAIGALPARRTHERPDSTDPPSADDPFVPRQPSPSPDPFEVAPSTRPGAGEEIPRAVPDRSETIDLQALAALCTRLACVTESADLVPLLDDAVRLLDAGGLVLWLWDGQGRELRPVLAQGYSADVVARLPGVPGDSDAAIAASFRSIEPVIVDGNAFETGAVVVPLATPAGCAGVLAIEFRDGGERRAVTRACASILAAQLSALVGYPPLAQAATA